MLVGSTVRERHDFSVTCERASTVIMNLSCVLLCSIVVTHCVLKTSLFYGHSESRSAVSLARLNCFQVLVYFWVFV
jgi:hypothetical protein